MSQSYLDLYKRMKVNMGAPEGYTPIPGSRAGGYRKRKGGGGYDYWYPDLGRSSAGEARALGDETSDKKLKRAAQDALRVLGNPEAVAKRVFEGLKVTAHEFPTALTALGKLSRGQKPSKHDALALLSVTSMIGTGAIAGAVYGTGAGAAAFATKFAIHVAMEALHSHANTAYTGYAGTAFAEKLLDYGSHLVLGETAPGGEPVDMDEDAALEYITTIVRGMKHELERMARGNTELLGETVKKSKAFGFGDILRKARKGEQVAGSKYIRRRPDGKGGWDYTYQELGKKGPPKRQGKEAANDYRAARDKLNSALGDFRADADTVRSIMKFGASSSSYAKVPKLLEQMMSRVETAYREGEADLSDKERRQVNGARQAMKTLVEQFNRLQETNTNVQSAFTDSMADLGRSAVDTLAADPKMQQAAAANSLENFGYVAGPAIASAIADLVIDSPDADQLSRNPAAAAYMDEKSNLVGALVGDLYTQIKAEGKASTKPTASAPKTGDKYKNKYGTWEVDADTGIDGMVNLTSEDGRNTIAEAVSNLSRFYEKVGEAPAADTPFELTGDLEDAYGEGTLDAATAAKVERAALESIQNGGAVGVDISTDVALALESRGLVEIQDQDFGDQAPVELTDKGKKMLGESGKDKPVRRRGRKREKTQAELVTEYREAIQNSKNMTPKEKEAALKRATAPGFDPAAALASMADEDEEEVMKGFGYLLNLVKAEKPPKGFTAIPKGKKGGYRKKVGTGYQYWYPDTGVTSSPKSEGGDDKPKPKSERMQVAGAESLSEGVRERIAKYSLDVIPDGVSPAKAVEIAKLLERGIDKAADLCKQDPPVCAGNMDIPRADMPQIMDDPIKQMLRSDEQRIQEHDEKAKKKGKPMFADLPEKDQQDDRDSWALERKKANAAVAAGADATSDKSPFEMMLDHFREQGISISEPTPMNVGELKATQRDIQAKKATGMAEAAMNESVPWSPNLNPIVISSDNHILDGHHRWAAMAMLGDKGQMKVIRVDLPMTELLDRSYDTPGAGVFRMDLENNVVEGPKPDYAEYKRRADAKLAEAGKRVAKGLPWFSYLSLLKAYESPLEKADEDEDDFEEEEEDDDMLESEREMLEEERALEKGDDEADEADEDDEEDDEGMDKGHGYHMDKGHGTKVAKGFNYVWRSYRH